MEHFPIVLLLLVCAAVFVRGKTYSAQEADELVSTAADVAEAESENVRKERRKNRENGRDKKGTRARDRHHANTKQKTGAEDVIARGRNSVAATEALVDLTQKPLAEIQSDPEVVAAFQAQESLCQDTSVNCAGQENSRFRTDDGTCNNLQHPLWGAAFTTQRRSLPADYEDGINSPRTEGKNGKLPAARKISNELFQKNAGSLGTPKDDDRTLITFAWGQFLDHDMVATPTATGDGGTTLTCCDGATPLTRTDCFALPLGPDDDFFGSKGCMEFVRSAPAPASTDQCQPGPRQQLNQLTSFLDAGAVYGDHKDTWDELDDRDGKMDTHAGNLLPDGGDHLPCVLSNPAQDYCQNAGDHRVNVVASLGGVHLLFVREHNRIANRLNQLTNWGSKRIFNETRKIIGALIQHVTYNEYLPEVLGAKAMDTNKLRPLSNGYADVYNRDVNPSITNVFAVAAYRFGHSMIPPHLGYTLQNFTTLESENMPLEDTLLDPHMLITDGGSRVSDLARFIASHSARKVDSKFEDAVRNKLFSDGNGNSFDLMSFNIQRGRDHGVPGYYAWREWCGLSKTLEHIPEADRDVLIQLYGIGNEEDIDVFVGGISETPEEDGATGPLFTCIIGRQFRNLKEGDRYYYERPQPEGFNEEQLQAIRNVSLAKLFCDNMGLEKVQRQLFLMPDIPGNEPVECNSLTPLDLDAWRTGGDGGSGGSGGGGGSGGSGGRGGGGGGSGGGRQPGPGGRDGNRRRGQGPSRRG